MFSLYSHGILGVVFTPPVGYSRPPSAVNDLTVIKQQVNSGKSCLEEMSQLLYYQVSLINQHWVHLHGDFRKKKESTMFLASSTKTKNSFVSIVGYVELLLLVLSRQCLFEVRAVPDWHGIGTNLVRTNPPITFVIVNFLWSQMVGMIFVHKIIHLATNIFSSTHLNHIPAEFVISYESIVDALVVLLFALLLELMGDVVFLVSWLLSVTVPMGSPFLYIVVRNRKEVHRVLDEFLILLCSFSQEVPARAIDDAHVPV